MCDSRRECGAIARLRGARVSSSSAPDPPGRRGWGGWGGGLGGFKCTTVVRLLPHPVSVNKGRDMCEPWMDEQGEDHTHAHQSDGISEKREA